MWISGTYSMRYLCFFNSTACRGNVVKQTLIIFAMGILLLAVKNITWAATTMTYTVVADLSNDRSECSFLQQSIDPYISSPKFYAYIDPGTGSFIIQLLLGFLFGGLFAIKLFWSRIKRFVMKLLFSKRDTRKDED